MTTSARIGFGIKFQTGNGAAPEVFSDMAEVTNVTPPNMARDSIDATHEQSTNGWREFIAGLKDGGEVALELNFIPGGTAILAAMAEFALDPDEATKNRRILFTDGTYFAFAAFLTGNEPDGPLDDKMPLALTYKVSGEVTLVQP